MLRYSWYINQSTTRQVKTKLLPWTQEQSFEFDSVGGVPLCNRSSGENTEVLSKIQSPITFLWSPFV